MIITASGDLHCDETNRFDEFVRVHKWVAEQVAKEKPAAHLIPGDVYERGSTPREREAAAECIQAVADVCPVVITRGNHDRITDLLVLGRLKTKHPVIVVESCGFFEVGGLRLAAIAWPNRASIAAMIGDPVAPDAIDDVARELLRGVLRKLGTHDPHVLMGHFMVDGSKVSEHGQPRCGLELNIPLSDLGMARAAITIMGHIHCPQEWTWNERPILYTGSPFRNDFGETETKSIVVADVNDHGVEWSRLVTLARQMLLGEDEWGVGPNGDQGFLVGWHGLDPALAVGADVRLRYKVSSDMLEPAKLAAAEVEADLYRRGAALV